MRPDRDGGFTLLEVLIAFLIAAMALAVLFRTAVEGQAAATTAARYQEALSRARSRLAAVDSIPLQAGDQSGDDGGGYRWRTRVASVAEGAPVREGPPSPALYAVAVAIAWGEGSGARSVQLETRRLGPPAPRPP
ncbi:type IV pilus modification PilV family protein [Pararoseomonas indoligenes]|uniref:Prepilin-type N-terminal cleavage/methylation domain-containing protein n=1 Tax=Roseomonas indoligenes TaxID=2820811 RepID=A0A940S7H8_9PROT|nr:prepilin-type N-terminal cleavage/methylation domain-containing protein [Pararoseomonas indoligenes]MBP0494950.1 prepilin-type N-terminal cleavage/methylation domain-containing protein [Pararoseomonas indoligenes]